MNEIIKKILHIVLPISMRNWIRMKRTDLYEKYIEWCKYHHKKAYADYLFKKAFGYGIDWKHPRDLNEVINVLAFTTDTTEWTRLADKYKVREFVKERGCENILVPLYGHWDKVEDIDFDSLPNKFVLKCNNGYGDVTIIKDKSKMDRNHVLNRLSTALTSRFGLETCEPHYLRIKPCIIAEQLLEPQTGDLTDYKVWCFDGKPYCIFTGSNRDIINHTCDFNIFDTNWKRKDDCMAECKRNDVIVPKPYHLDDILEYAKKLSKGFPEVRVDFYEVNGKIYIGEMTFTSACGRMDYFTSGFLKEMGKQVKI